MLKTVFNKRLKNQLWHSNGIQGIIKLPFVFQIVFVAYFHNIEVMPCIVDLLGQNNGLSCVGEGVAKKLGKFCAHVGNIHISGGQPCHSDDRKSIVQKMRVQLCFHGVIVGNQRPFPLFCKTLVLVVNLRKISLDRIGEKDDLIIAVSGNSRNIFPGIKNCQFICQLSKWLCEISRKYHKEGGHNYEHDYKKQCADYEKPFYGGCKYGRILTEDHRPSGLIGKMIAGNRKISI